MPSGRIKGGKNKSYTFDFRMKVVKEYLTGESLMTLEQKYKVNISLISAWASKYKENGEEGLKNKRIPRNPFVKYINKKEFTEVEKLEYEIAKRDHELLKKEIEILKLKKLQEIGKRDSKRKK